MIATAIAYSKKQNAPQILLAENGSPSRWVLAGRSEQMKWFARKV